MDPDSTAPDLLRRRVQGGELLIQGFEIGRGCEFGVQGSEQLWTAFCFAGMASQQIGAKSGST